MLGNIRILFLLRLSGIFCMYMHLVFSIASSFSNTVATVRNESRKILEYLMHFCNSSCYVMWQAFYSLSHLHIQWSIFGTAFFGFCSSFLGLCPVLCSSILNLYIYYLTTNFDANSVLEIIFLLLAVILIIKNKIWMVKCYFRRSNILFKRSKKEECF